MAPAKLAAWFKQHNAAPAAVLMDSKGDVGRAFGAKVTPHMYVIDPNGTLVYAGAIDDKRSANVADVKTASNYVVTALTEAKVGQAGVENDQPGLRLHDQVQLESLANHCAARSCVCSARVTRRRAPRRNLGLLATLGLALLVNPVK